MLVMVLLQPNKDKIARIIIVSMNNFFIDRHPVKTKFTD